MRLGDDRPGGGQELDDASRRLIRTDVAGADDGDISEHLNRGQTIDAAGDHRHDVARLDAHDAAVDATGRGLGAVFDAAGISKRNRRHLEPPGRTGDQADVSDTVVKGTRGHGIAQIVIHKIRHRFALKVFVVAADRDARRSVADAAGDEDIRDRAAFAHRHFGIRDSAKVDGVASIAGDEIDAGREIAAEESAGAHSLGEVSNAATGAADADSSAEGLIGLVRSLIVRIAEEGRSIAAGTGDHEELGETCPADFHLAVQHRATGSTAQQAGTASTRRDDKGIIGIRTLHTGDIAASAADPSRA